MSKRNQSAKVYHVHTGVAANGKGKDHEDECLNWAKYTVTAPDAELAISFAKVKFSRKGEYVQSVEFVCELDE